MWNPHRQEQRGWPQGAQSRRSPPVQFAQIQESGTGNSVTFQMPQPGHSVSVGLPQYRVAYPQAAQSGWALPTQYGGSQYGTGRSVSAPNSTVPRNTLPGIIRVSGGTTTRSTEEPVSPLQSHEEWWENQKELKKRQPIENREREVQEHWRRMTQRENERKQRRESWMRWITSLCALVLAYVIYVNAIEHL